jgi:hypothetical protein
MPRSEAASASTRPSASSAQTRRREVPQSAAMRAGRTRPAPVRTVPGRSGAATAGAGGAGAGSVRAFIP